MGRFKWLALLARGIGGFPFFIVLSYLYSKQYSESLFSIQLIGLMIVIAIGYIQVNFHGFLEQKLSTRIALRHIIVGSLYILIVGLMINGIWKYFQSDTITKWLTCVIYIVFYGMSIKAYGEHYTRILSIEIIVIISFCYVIAGLLSKQSILGIMYLFVIGAYIFLNNQQKLEGLLRSTQENTPMFKNIRRDNMKKVSLVMGCILIVYPFRLYIASMIWWIWQKALSIISFIAYIIVMLLSLLNSNETITEGAAANSGMGYMEEAEKNEWLDVLFWVLIWTIAIYVCIKRRKEIIQAIRNTWRKIQRLIGIVYQLLFGKKQAVTVTEEYYKDTIEEMDEVNLIPIEQSQMLTKKRWIRQVKKYLKSPSEIDQYREGYKLLLQGIKIKGIEIEKAHTPREIMALTKKSIGIPAIEVETKYYEEVRYGEQIATLKGIEELKQILKELIEVTKQA